MKKALFALLFIFQVAFAGAIHADQIKDQFPNPFANFYVDMALWSVEYSTKLEAGFTLRQDKSVIFGISKGQPLGQVSLTELARQFEKAKNLGDVPLLNESFPHMTSDIPIESWLETEVKDNGCVKFYCNAIMGNIGPCQIESYIFVVENRIYVINFGAPQEKFPDLELLFNTTLNHL